MINVSRGKIVKRTWTWQGHKRVAYLFDVQVDGRRSRKQYQNRAEALAALAYKGERLAAVRSIGEERTERKLSAAAVNRPLALLRHTLRMAHRWKVLSEVPAIDLVAPKSVHRVLGLPLREAPLSRFCLIASHILEPRWVLYPRA